jgi:hypothetical protein
MPPTQRVTDADAIMRHGDAGGIARRTVTLNALTDVTRDGDVIVLDANGRHVARIPSQNITELTRGN